VRTIRGCVQWKGCTHPTTSSLFVESARCRPSQVSVGFGELRPRGWLLSTAFGGEPDSASHAQFAGSTASVRSGALGIVSGNRGRINAFRVCLEFLHWGQYERQPENDQRRRRVERNIREELNAERGALRANTAPSWRSIVRYSTVPDPRSDRPRSSTPRVGLESTRPRAVLPLLAARSRRVGRRDAGVPRQRFALRPAVPDEARGAGAGRERTRSTQSVESAGLDAGTDQCRALVKIAQGCR
jgi:hypothetical protein